MLGINKFGKKKGVRVYPVYSTPPSTIKAIENLDRMATEIHMVSGYTLEEILGLFKSGYTLTPPEQISFDDLERMAENRESM